MEKVGRGVVGLDGMATVAGDGEGHGVTDRGEITFDLVGDCAADFLSADDFGLVESAGITFLSAHFGEEDGLVGDDEVIMDFKDGRFAGILFEADEFSDRIGREVEGADDGLFLRSAGEFAGFFHTGFDGGFIERDAPLTTKESSEIEREAEGVVELEGVFGREDFSFGCFLEFFETAVEGLVEGLFFESESFFHHFGAGSDFREDLAKLGDYGVDEFGEEICFAVEAEGAAVFDGAAEDASKDIVSSGVAWHYAVGN